MRLGSIPNSNMALINTQILWHKTFRSTSLICAALSLLLTKSVNLLIVLTVVIAIATAIQVFIALNGLVCSFIPKSVVLLIIKLQSTMKGFWDKSHP
jgi:hypothetical protein